MITSLKIGDRKKICIPWWGGVDFLKRKRVLHFQPGLNILWGPNGSGKTTLLLGLARMMFCEQANHTCITNHAIHELFPIRSADFKLPADERARKGFLGGLEVVHDGQAVQHFDPSKTVGLVGGGAGFDDDFFMSGLQECTRKASAGETTVGRLDDLFGILIGEREWPEVEWKARRETHSEAMNAQVALIDERLAPGIEPGNPTILLDEPDRSLGVPYQYGLWNRLTADAERFQIIVATHSLFAVNVPGAHYIETKTGYLGQCREAVRRAFGSVD
jgi:predicted ATPase